MMSSAMMYNRLASVPAPNTVRSNAVVVRSDDRLNPVPMFVTVAVVKIPPATVNET